MVPQQVAVCVISGWASGNRRRFHFLHVSGTCLWHEKLTRSKQIYPAEPKKAQQAVVVPGAFVNRRLGWRAGQLGDLFLFLSRK